MFSLSEPTVLSVFLFSYSSLASLVVEESLYTSALSIARFASLFSPYFSNLPEIVLFLSRDRLCRRRPPFSPARAHGLLVASLRILVRFNFLGNPLLPPIFTRFTRTASYPQAHSISAPSLFEISVFRFVRRLSRFYQLLAFASVVHFLIYLS